jgi:hypothetical protein
MGYETLPSGPYGAELRPVEFEGNPWREQPLNRVPWLGETGAEICDMVRLSGLGTSALAGPNS